MFYYHSWLTEADIQLLLTNKDIIHTMLFFAAIFQPKDPSKDAEKSKTFKSEEKTKTQYINSFSKKACELVPFK